MPPALSRMPKLANGLVYTNLGQFDLAAGI
jgi:hypothetical protein